MSGHPGRNWGLEEYDQGVCGRSKVVPHPTLSRLSPLGSCCSRDPFACLAPGENETLDFTCRDQSAIFFLETTLSYLKTLILTTLTAVPRLFGVCMHNATSNPPSVQWVFPGLPVKWRPGHHLTQSWWGNKPGPNFFQDFLSHHISSLMFCGVCFYTSWKGIYKNLQIFITKPAGFNFGEICFPMHAWSCASETIPFASCFRWCGSRL